MVRLKAITVLYKLGLTFIFQFQYGAIKRGKRIKFQFHCANFNSNMVRLKGGGDDTTIPAIVSFQFQYGAIKRIVEGERFSGLFIFQFQYGAIKRKTF